VRQLEQEKDRRLQDLTSFADINKKNIELKRQITTVLQENESLTSQNQQAVA
jgi:hypothetical protein